MKLLHFGNFLYLLLRRRRWYIRSSVNNCLLNISKQVIIHHKRAGYRDINYIISPFGDLGKESTMLSRDGKIAQSGSFFTRILGGFFLKRAGTGSKIKGRHVFRSVPINLTRLTWLDLNIIFSSLNTLILS